LAEVLLRKTDGSDSVDGFYRIFAYYYISSLYCKTDIDNILEEIK